MRKRRKALAVAPLVCTALLAMAMTTTAPAASALGTACTADIDGPGGAPDGVVDTLDLLLVLAQWGTPGPEGDITGPAGTPDGIVDVLDLLEVIAQWGDCPVIGPPNDDCINNVEIFDGLTPFSTVGATTDGPAHAECDFDGQTYHDIWFSYVASCSGDLTVSTCEDVGGSALYDTDLVVYDGCDCANLVLLGCNDDDPNNPCGFKNFHSTVQVPVVSGNCYLVRVGGWMDGDFGSGDLSISCLPISCWSCPAGSSSENPVQACPVDGDNADLDPNGGCNSNPVSFDAITCGETVCAQMSTYVSSTGGDFRDTDWFLFEATASGTYTLTCNGEGQTLFGIVSGVDTCVSPGFVVFDTTLGDCDERAVVADLTPGLYAAFAAPPVFTGVPCTDYWLRLDCVLTPPEACCLPDGTCFDADPFACTTKGGIPQGPGSACATTVCPQPTEACCFTDGTCSDIEPLLCLKSGGTPQGPDTTCAGVICIKPDQACCFLDGSCLDLPPSACISQGGTPMGMGTSCGFIDCPPPNDDCTNAIQIGEGTIPFATFGATTDGLPDALCNKFGTDQVWNDIWYCYMASCTGTVTVTTCGQADYDTKLAAYVGCIECPPTAILDCNDDTCSLQSEISFSAVAGQSYLIRVGSFSAKDWGSGAITVSCVVPLEACCFFDGSCQDLLAADCLAAGGTPQGSGTSCASVFCPPPPPPNDPCSAALPISDGDTPFDTTSASTDGLAHSSCQFDGQTYNDIWYHYTATCVGTLTVSTCNQASYDSDLVVYTGCGVCPPGDAQLLGCNDDGPGCSGFTSEVMVPVSANHCYTIRVGGWMSGDYGSGILTVSCSNNDSCLDAAPIFEGDTPFDTTFATTDGLPHAACQWDGQTYRDIWYDHIATCTGTLRVSTCGQADYDSDLVVYDGCTVCPPGDAELLGCADETVGCPNLTSMVEVPVVAGNCYRIRVGGWMDSNFGTGTVTVDCFLTPDSP